MTFLEINKYFFFFFISVGNESGESHSEYRLIGLVISGGGGVGWGGGELDGGGGVGWGAGEQV